MGKFNEAEVGKAQKAFREKFHELDTLIGYPPFSTVPNFGTKQQPEWGYPTTTDLGDKLVAQLFKEANRIRNIVEDPKISDPTDVDPDIYKDMFGDVIAQFKEDLDVAQMWQKRYPDSPSSACIKDAE